MSNPKQSPTKRVARAPYNFVPLPHDVVLAEEAVQKQPTFDQYETEKYYTGKIECNLTTQSTLYTRAAVDPDFFDEWSQNMENLHADEEAQRKYAQFFHHGDHEVPVIPGSSLRGMVRHLMEIVAHGHMRWVGKSPTFTFRAVAASRNDPLREPYQKVLGKFGANVRAGYIEKKGSQWLIQPALTPQDLNWQSNDKYYFKIKEQFISPNSVSGLQRLNSKTYKPSWFPVCFSVNTSGRSTQLDQIADYGKGLPQVGLLVCSGNMLETGKSNQTTPRKKHSLILAPNRKKALIPIEDQAIEDYRAGLSPYQNDELDDWGGKDWGCLKEGAPVFYVVEQDDNGKDVVRYFGHNPNFRIPARLDGANRAATPLDFVPKHLKEGDSPDLVEALFGWIEDKSAHTNDLKGQRAGRLSFSDARYQSDRSGRWLQSDSVTLRTLSGPKPTTFQHYLVQDKEHAHDPNRLEQLAHYGSSPEETQIRGHKLYWHKGSDPKIHASNEELEHPTQLTQVRPVKAGVNFGFTIRFENLTEVELGGLLWVLTLPGEEGKTYHHKLGMGKPLGMGAISLSPQLTLDDRTERYTTLFAHEQWSQPSNASKISTYIRAFESYILADLEAAGISMHELPRIRALLTLLEWREGTSDWLDKTRYLEIERGTNKDNEYKERPVLPTVFEVTKTPAPVEPKMRAARPIIEADPPKPTIQRKESTQAPSDRRVESTNVSPLNANEHEGIVDKFGLGPNQSFGFIQYDGREIFVHRNQLVDKGQTLAEGARVRFTIGQGRNGDQAENVKIVRPS